MAKKQNKTVNLKALMVRMSPELYQWLAEQAERNHRSLNAEVVVNLEREYQRSKAGGPPFGD